MFSIIFSVQKYVDLTYYPTIVLYFTGSNFLALDDDEIPTCTSSKIIDILVCYSRGFMPRRKSKKIKIHWVSQELHEKTKILKINRCHFTPSYPLLIPSLTKNSSIDKKVFNYPINLYEYKTNLNSKIRLSDFTMPRNQTRRSALIYCSSKLMESDCDNIDHI